MNKVNLGRLERCLVQAFGINVAAQLNGDNVIDIRPTDVQRGTGFKVRIVLGWRSVRAEFLPDDYAANLIKAMEVAEAEKKMVFQSVATTICSHHEELTFRINGSEVSPIDMSSWPSDWRDLLISVSRIPVITEELNHVDTQIMVERIALEIMGLVVSLLPLEEMVEAPTGLPEGALSRVEVNRYERSSINREACILAHGCVCKVCLFDFEKFYGPIGSGFIHVHHVTPVSQLGPDYIINPITDLVPVCPNCHAMLHRVDPPLEVEQLREMIDKAQFLNCGG